MAEEEPFVSEVWYGHGLYSCLTTGGNDRARRYFTENYFGKPDQMFKSDAAEEYRQTLKQEVYKELGYCAVFFLTHCLSIPLEEDEKMVQLDPELRRFAGATAFGSADFQPKHNPEPSSSCNCCTIF